LAEWLRNPNGMVDAATLQTTNAELAAVAKFTVTIYEIAAHGFTVDAVNEEAAIRLARAEFDALVDPDTCVSLGLDPARSPTVTPARDASAGQSVMAALGYAAHGGRFESARPPSGLVN
jgi:hypothetical protein